MEPLTHLPVLGDRNYAPRAGGSDCIICTNEKLEKSGLEILHITEGLSYHPQKQIVRILINLIFYHKGNTPTRFRVIHRGKTTASLQKFAFDDPNDPRSAILSQLCNKRLKKSSDNHERVIFHKRVNCFGIDPKGIEVSLAGPGGCFEKTSEEIILTSEIEDPRENIPFSSYLIPPLDVREIKPNETAICTIKLEIAGETYMHLVGNGSDISVDGHRRLMRDIETYDLPDQYNKAFEELYFSKVKPKKAIIQPHEYDIVIFQKLGQSIVLKSGSISTIPVRLTDEELSEKVLWYFGEGCEFCLRFAYPSEIITQQQQIKKEVLAPYG